MTEKLISRIKIASKETQDVLNDYFSRMSNRLGGIVTQFEDIENKAIKATNKIDLPNLNSQLSSYPDVLRVLEELHAYIKESGEELSKLHLELEEAKKEVNEIAQVANTARHKAINLQMVAQEGLVFTRGDYSTFDKIMKEVDRHVAQEVLERLPTSDWEKWEELFTEVQKTRRK